MTPYWSNIIAELQASGLTLERIAEEMGVSVRQVSNWKAGSEPKGITAIRLHSLHVKHRTALHGSGLHSLTATESGT